MKKGLLPLVVSCFIATPFLSFGVGLGSVRTHSNLNEPLRAEIPVLLVKQRRKMSVGLAPDAVFSQHGMTRSQELRNLRFSLIKKAQRYYVKVSSTKPITTPYLNFILELNDEDGKTYREYAVFLDPASSNRKASKVKKKPLSVAHPKKAVHKDKQKTSDPVQKVAEKKTRKDSVRSDVVRKDSAKKASVRKDTAKKTSKKSIGIPTVKGKVGYYGPVKRGETLTRIALRVRPSKKISVYNMIRLLEEANPKLKYGLKADSTLKVPTIKGYPTYQKDSQKSNHQADKQKKSSSAPIALSKPVVKEKTTIVDTVADKNFQPESIPIVTKIVSNPEEAIKTTIKHSINDTIEEKPISAQADINNGKVEETAKTKPITTTVQSSNQVLVNDSTLSDNKNATTETTTTDVRDADATPNITTGEKKSNTAVTSKTTESETTESEKGGFELPFRLPLMPLLAGVGTLLLGLLALLFVRRRRESVDTKDVVLLDDEQLTADDSVLLDKNAATATAIATEETSEHINDTNVVLADKAEDVSEKEETLTRELSDLDNEAYVSANKPVSVLPNELVSESKEEIEALEEIADDNMLDFNLDEPSQTEVQEEANIQLDENIVNEETVSSDTDEGLAFELNDDVTDDLSDEDMQASDKLVSEMNSIDFDINDKMASVENVAASIAIEQSNTLDNHSDDNVSSHTEMEMKLAMAETFISMSNAERAKELLQQVIQEGTADQIEKAQAILKGLS